VRYRTALRPAAILRGQTEEVSGAASDRQPARQPATGTVSKLYQCRQPGGVGIEPNDDQPSSDGKRPRRRYVAQEGIGVERRITLPPSRTFVETTHADLPVSQRNTPPHPARQDEAHRRYFRDETGGEWEVREVALPAYDRRSGSCLIFESRDVIRRVRTFPPNWFELSERDLRDLSGKR
jgi:hypothetical protein